MSFTYGFYNSVDGDRKYNAEQVSAIFDGLIHDGVFDSVGEIFATTPGEGLQVIVGSGKAWFKHTWNVNDAAIPLAIEAPDILLPRIDAVVLEVNNTKEVRANSIKIVKGTPASSPTKPALVRTELKEGINQYALAYVTVDQNATEIALSKIEINVGKSDCPFVTSIVQSTDIDALFNQWNGEFDEWFENLKAQLTDDVVTNLQRQIDENRTNIDDLDNQVATLKQNQGLIKTENGKLTEFKVYGELNLYKTIDLNSGWQVSMDKKKLISENLIYANGIMLELPVNTKPIYLTNNFAYFLSSEGIKVYSIYDAPTLYDTINIGENLFSVGAFCCHVTTIHNIESESPRYCYFAINGERNDYQFYRIYKIDMQNLSCVLVKEESTTNKLIDVNIRHSFCALNKFFVLRGHRIFTGSGGSVDDVYLEIYNQNQNDPIFSTKISNTSWGSGSDALIWGVDEFSQKFLICGKVWNATSSSELDPMVLVYDFNGARVQSYDITSDLLTYRTSGRGSSSYYGLFVTGQRALVQKISPSIENIQNKVESDLKAFCLVKYDFSEVSASDSPYDAHIKPSYEEGSIAIDYLTGSIAASSSKPPFLIGKLPIISENLPMFRIKNSTTRTSEKVFSDGLAIGNTYYTGGI